MAKTLTQCSIILTTTVTISEYIQCIKQRDPTERLNTYLKAINNWIALTNFKIILVENSGYSFPELEHLRESNKDRFEIISFDQNELEDACHLIREKAKGVCEVFSINYAIKHSKLLQDTNFIIKVTGRYYIPELQNYLEKYDLNLYDCLTQHDRDRCEMVGSHVKNTDFIFNVNLVDKNGNYDNHIENVWKYRTSCFDNNLHCKIFTIERTQRGCGNKYVCFENI